MRDKPEVELVQAASLEAEDEDIYRENKDHREREDDDSDEDHDSDSDADDSDGSDASSSGGQADDGGAEDHDAAPAKQAQQPSQADNWAAKQLEQDYCTMREDDVLHGCIYIEDRRPDGGYKGRLKRVQILPRKRPAGADGKQETVTVTAELYY